MAIKINGVTVIDDSQNGTLSGTQSVAGNVTAGNVRTGGVVSAAGQVTGSQFNGSGAGLTSIPAANVTGTLSVNTTGYAATVSGAAQGNITSVGTLTALSVSGNVNAGNVIATHFGSGAGLSSITGANVTGTVPSATTAGTVTTAAQGNITSVGTLTSLSVSGNVNAGNVIATHFGSGAGLSSITGANVTGTVPSATNATNATNASNVPWTGVSSRPTAVSAFTNDSGYLTSSGTIANATNASNVPWTGVSSRPTAVSAFTNDSGYLTSSGTITNATNVTGTAGTLGYSTASVGVGYAGTGGPQVMGSVSNAAQISLHRAGAYAINMGLDTDNVFRIGGWSDGNNTYRFQVNAAGVATVTATNARYADLAEMYAADAEYAPGTVVCFGGDQEVTVCTHESDTRVAGVISTNPSYLMNATLESEHVAAVALTGRVPTRVVGTVRKGDLMVSAGNGAAKADNNARNGAVIGKALADFDGAEGVIEVVVGRF